MDSYDSEQTDRRNWPEVREWANLAIALTALLIGVVTFWTTTQISGLEDYFRSEISRRNVELENATLESQGLDARVRQSEDRLEELRLLAERLGVSNSEAQSQIAGMQAQSLELMRDQSQTQLELEESRTELTKLGSEVNKKEDILTEYRRQEVLAHAYRVIQYIQYADLWRNESEGEREEIDGPYGLKELRSIGLSITEPSISPYYANIRTAGASMCRHLEGYAPQLPKFLPNPLLGPRPGRRDKDGTVWMTNREVEEWNAKVASWSEKWDQVGRYNASIRTARNAINSYVTDSLRSCACRAIYSDAQRCPETPQRPTIDIERAAS